MATHRTSRTGSFAPFKKTNRFLSHAFVDSKNSVAFVLESAAAERRLVLPLLTSAVPFFSSLQEVSELPFIDSMACYTYRIPSVATTMTMMTTFFFVFV
jgi:hypothetical protein